MTHCLVSFLGNSQLKQGVASYREVDYRFPDGQTDHAAFFGFPLQRHVKADKLIIFGTTGSMWDHLFDNLTVDDEATHEKLLEQVENDATAQDTLDTLAPALEASLGCTVRLQLIPAAFAREEQTRLLNMLADAADGATELSLDVTHGYRHMPMLTFTAALYLRTLRPQLKIKGLWYGYIDGTVSNLDGLLETADWLSALQRHEWLGDYTGVAELLASDDPELAEELRRASFLASIHQSQHSRTSIRNARKRLQALPSDGPIDLFRPVLEQRMRWVDEQSLYLRQRRQALEALNRFDYLRASLYGFEAFITSLVKDQPRTNQDQNAHEARETARQTFWENRYSQPKSRRDAYSLLNNLRNVLAHGNRAKTKAAQSAIADPASLHNALSDCINELLPETQ